MLVLTEGKRGYEEQSRGVVKGGPVGCVENDQLEQFFFSDIN